MAKILILSNESGNGHKQTAHVLANALQQDARTIRIVNTFQELFIDLDHSARWFGISGEDIYNKFILQNEASQFFYKFFFFFIYYSFVVPYQNTFIQRFSKFFEQEKPDLIISVIPILNREIAAAINQRYPFLIVQTDLFEYQEQSPFWRWSVPCGAWFVADKTTHIATGTQKGYQQALRYQPDKNKVIQLSGTVIDPNFLHQVNLDITLEKEKLGLNRDKPVGLFLYGGHPPDRIYKLAKQLNQLDVIAQFIFICGKNDRLRNYLEDLITRYQKIVLGYSNEIPYYMRVSDFLIGKAGPGSIMESIALGLPVLLDVSHVMPHEEHNASWVEQQNFGMSFKTSKQLHGCIQHLGESNHIKHKSRKIFKNNAIFEVTEWVEQILSTGR